MDFNTRRKYYNLCFPYEPLEPNDSRNVDLDLLGKADMRVRGVNWVDRLASKIELADRPMCILFTGLRGSGKSTELKRLAARLSRPEGANYLSVLIDSEELLDLTNPVDIPDIIASILHKTEEAVLGAEGRDPADAMKEGYITRLWHWLSKTDVELKKAELAVPDAGKLVIEMKTRPSLRQRVRETIAVHLTRFLDEARKEITLFNDRARQRGRRGVVIVFDSLEKLRGSSTNWHEVLDSAEKIFSGGAPYLCLPVHIVYTVPPALATRSLGVEEYLPMVKLMDQEKKQFEAGIEAARELIRKRIPDDILVQLLGPETEQRIKRLILWSGGYPREIVRLLQAVIQAPEHPLSEAHFKRILNEVTDSYRKLVPSDTFAWLAGVARDKYLTMQNDEHRKAADLMLSNNVVLRYLNDSDWFDLHPSVYTIPGVKDAIRQAQESRGGTTEEEPLKCEESS